MAQLKRGGSPATSLHRGLLVYVGTVIGPGASSAPTLPALTVTAAKDNFVLSAAYTSVGLYVLTLKELPGTILDIRADIHRAAGTTLKAAVRSWDTTLKTVTIDIRDGAAAFAAAEAAITDTITVIIHALNSSA